jgi:DNA-binding CsgD family transcriptional regulator
VPSDYQFMQTGLCLATGWTLAANGALTDAIAAVQAGAVAARERGQPTHELALLQAAVQWGDASVAPRARELADLLTLPLADAVAGHAESLLAGNGDGLLDASAKYRALGDRATAADAAAQAAVAFASALHGKRGRYAAALAQELAEQCGGLCTPALRTPVTALPLTPRQREIAELVAAGLSNKDIGERLMMSVRTVEGHLLRTCKRVGAASRAELTAIMLAGPGGPS